MYQYQYRPRHTHTTSSTNCTVNKPSFAVQYLQVKLGKSIILYLLYGKKNQVIDYSGC